MANTHIDPKCKDSFAISSLSALGTAEVKELPGRSEQDADLIRRIVDHSDKYALQDLALHYGPRLKSFLICRGEQQHTAEDIIQEVMITVWTKAAQFDARKGSFSSWIYRMTRNKWIDHKRKHDRLQPTAPEIMSSLSDNVVEAVDVDLERAEVSSEIRKQLAILPTKQKQILHLSFFEGLSHSQIAERTGLPLGTVKGRIRSALTKMRPGMENFRGQDQ